MGAGQWIAVAAVAVPVIGWFATSALQSAGEVRRQRITAVLEHTGKQLEQLYGPLTTLLIEGQQAWHTCLRSLDRDPANPNASEELRAALSGEGTVRLTAEEQERWVFWIENAFFPRNDAIQKLLAEKAHLIEGPPDGPLIPRSYVQFLEHHNGWKMQHRLWREQGRPYPWCWTSSWPDTFTDEVALTFRALKARYDQFLKAQRRHGLFQGGFGVPDEPHPRVAELSPAGGERAGVGS